MTFSPPNSWAFISIQRWLLAVVTTLRMLNLRLCPARRCKWTAARKYSTKIMAYKYVYIYIYSHIHIYANIYKAIDSYFFQLFPMTCENIKIVFKKKKKGKSIAFSKSVTLNAFKCQLMFDLQENEGGGTICSDDRNMGTAFATGGCYSSTSIVLVLGLSTMGNVPAAGLMTKVCSISPAAPYCWHILIVTLGARSKTF